MIRHYTPPLDKKYLHGSREAYDAVRMGRPKRRQGGNQEASFSMESQRLP